MPDIEITQECSVTNVLLRYNLQNSMNNEITSDLGMQSVKKYQKFTAQIIDKLSHLYNIFLTLAVLFNKTAGNYDQIIQVDKPLRFEQNKNYEWVFSYFYNLHISVQYSKIDRKNIANMFLLVKEFIWYYLVWDCPTVMLNGIIYGLKEMKQIKKVFEKEK